MNESKSPFEILQEIAARWVKDNESFLDNQTNIPRSDYARVVGAKLIEEMINRGLPIGSFGDSVDEILASKKFVPISDAIKAHLAPVPMKRTVADNTGDPINAASTEIQQTASMAEVVDRKFPDGARAIGGAGMAISRRHAELVRQRRTAETIGTVLEKLSSKDKAFQNALKSAGDAVGPQVEVDHIKELFAAMGRSKDGNEALQRTLASVAQIANARSQAVQTALGTIQRIISSALEDARTGDTNTPKAGY